MNENWYRNKSTFLADINNENEVNEQYVNRLHALKKLVLVKFLNDTIAIPKDTEWFQFYMPNQSHRIQNLEDSKVFVFYQQSKDFEKCLYKTKSFGNLFKLLIKTILEKFEASTNDEIKKT